jgi:hypothetical protein
VRSGGIADPLLARRRTVSNRIMLVRRAPFAHGGLLLRGAFRATHSCDRAHPRLGISGQARGFEAPRSPCTVLV